MDAQTWDERYSAADLVWGAEPNRFVREQCEELPPGDAVDLACGEGRNSLWLARRGWRVTGIDFSPVAIERARTLTAQEPPEVAERLTWLIADATTETVPRDSADLVVVAYLHLASDGFRRVLESAAGALRLGGTLVLVGHDRRNLTEGVSGPQDLTLLHDPVQIRAALEIDGLVVDLAETVERSTDQGVALDTLVRARRG
ncbi:MAG: class I SAM-dependent methyltransferase [Nocardioidaceae bacterium]